ncbi:hypothetical protein HRI_000661100 [Hibiscus trionum]|uniref:Uncharacterized protein n=1 Tax=Hibiscus trionum TaxID=183268 RepID=A0A9W7LM97_HIBTR|nr:hypothetical protein HRI_000661100 [Hibiscus trionum]
MYLRGLGKESVVLMNARNPSWYALSLETKGDPQLQNIDTVCKFPDVFLDELPGLPPTREVEFGIEVQPGTAAVSISPFRMAAVELKELKAQI